MLKVLQAERENCEGMGDGIAASATDRDIDMTGEAHKILVRNALGILVRNATEEFGFAPRDVYNGVFHLSRTRDRHAIHLNRLDYEQLEAIVCTFSQERKLINSDLSHRIIAISPLPSTPRGDHNYDHWTIDFKSIRIAKEVVESMRFEQDKYLWEMYHLLNNPESASLAGWVFEAIVHRMFSEGWWLSEPTPHPIRTGSIGCDPPVFSIDPSSLPSSAPDNSLSPLAPLFAGTRIVTRINFTARQLSGVALDNNRYYIPTVATTDPFFDSFAIGLDPDQHTALISVFRIATFPTYEGSVENHPLIRRITICVRELLKKVDPNGTVKVRYFLVCPEDVSHNKWKMPNDWNDTATHSNHCGGVSCILVPVPAPRYTFCLQ